MNLPWRIIAAENAIKHAAVSFVHANCMVYTLTATKDSNVMERTINLQYTSQKHSRFSSPSGVTFTARLRRKTVKEARNLKGSADRISVPRD